jgi:hypothetical protein
MNRVDRFIASDWGCGLVALLGLLNIGLFIYALVAAIVQGPR